ncbi:hypothetical protein [Serinicoccus sp. CNJ-927]|nr:hypothetical protein [Serinicoccus sp. CNJ-927]
MSSSLTAAPFTGLGVALATPFTTGNDAVGGSRSPLSTTTPSAASSST